MSTKKLENPFPVTGYHGPMYFCDRQEESARLISNLQSGNSTTLISIRRMGKTALIHHVLSQLPDGWRGIYIDILDTENLSQFLNKLATSIAGSVPEKSNFGKSFWNFLKSLRPTISYDGLTGFPQVFFDVKLKETEANIDSVLKFLDTRDFKTLIAIDEFQQIVNYPEGNTDAWLRTRIQQMKNVVFIFSGSEQHLMTEIFSSPKKPFFRSTHILKLEKLNPQVYCDFIIKQFQNYKKEISAEIVDEILEWGNIHTFYIQQICNRVFAGNPKKVTDDSWKLQVFDLLKEQEPVFFTYRNLLTNHQWQLLKAIAHEGSVYQPSSKEFLNKFNLGTSATVLRSLNALLRYELIYSDFDHNGTRFYSVYDVFLQRWCKEK